MLRIIKILVRYTTLLFSLALLVSYFSSLIPPHYFWYLQLFGLAYPVLLVSLIIFAILNFILNKKILFAVVVLLSGSFTHAKYFGFDFKSPEYSEFSDKEIKIMSFNVRLFDVYQNISPELTDSKKDFINLFQEESPDVLCIQEYAQDPSNKDLITPEELKKAGGYIDFTTTLTLERKKMQLGQSIFSKYPIIHADKIGDTTVSVPSIYADIVKENDTIRVYNFHLESIRFQEDEYSLFDTEVESSKSYTSRIKGLFSKLKKAYPLRVEQAQLLINHALRSPYPVIIAGDLNDPPTSYAYSLFNNHFKDAFFEADLGMTRTYAGKVPAGRIDYIFNTKELAAKEFKTWREKVISDHYPITATFLMMKDEFNDE